MHGTGDENIRRLSHAGKYTFILPHTLCTEVTPCLRSCFMEHTKILIDCINEQSHDVKILPGFSPVVDWLKVLFSKVLLWFGSLTPEKRDHHPQVQSHQVCKAMLAD